MPTLTNELSILLKSLDAALAEIKRSSDSIEKNRNSAATINTMIMKYNANSLITEKNRQALEFIEKAQILEDIDKVSRLLNSKKDDIEKKYFEEDLLFATKLTNSIQDYNNYVAIMVSAYSTLKCNSLRSSDPKHNLFRCSIL